MEEKKHIGLLFDRIADSYDGLNHVLSLDIDRIWRRKTVKAMPPAEHVLDVCIGTADLTIAMLRSGKIGRVTGLDLSDKMMAIGRAKCEKRNLAADFVHGNAQEMPFGDKSFDGVTCAFGCRNFQDLDAGLREMYRVLKPGKQVTILELSYPANPLIRFGYDLYFSHMLPTIGRLLSRDKTAYTYLNRSVKYFCWGEEFTRHLSDAGFVNARYKPLSLGIATLYTAIKE